MSDQSDFQELMQTVEDMNRYFVARTAQADQDAAQFNLDMKSQPCGACGHVFRYENGTIYACEHRIEQLKSDSEATVESPLLGIPVVKESVFPLSGSQGGLRGT